MKLILRAWLPDEKRMLHHSEISLTEGRIFERIYDERTGYMNSFPKDNAILMVCSGLKDENEKLIYEGDVLSNGKHINWQVGFHDGSFKVCLTNPMNIEKWTLNQGKASLRKIVGNIWNNPELRDSW